MVQRLLPNNPAAKSHQCHCLRRPPGRTNTEPDAAVGKLVSLKMVFSSDSLYLGGLRRLVPSLFKPQNIANVRFLVCGILLGFSFSLTATSFILYYREKKQRGVVSRSKPHLIEPRNYETVHGVTGLIGRSICTWEALYTH